MNWTKSIYAAISLVSAVAIAQGGVETMATTDLSRKPYTGVSWTWTASSDVTVRLAVQKNGDDFPTAGWGGTLFIGDGTLGCAVPGSAHRYNELLFDVDRGLMPTNGRYAVQIIATNAAGRVEEWSRGMLTVRANPSADGMPTNWNAYADLAAKVAPYINAEVILTSPDNAGALWGAVSNRTEALIHHSTTGAVAALESDIAVLQSATQTLQVAFGAMRTNAYTKGETDARIVELSPPTDLTPSTNYTDRALSSFAATGSVEEATYAFQLYNTEATYGYTATKLFWAATNAAVSVVSASNAALRAALAATNQALRAELRSATQALAEWHEEDVDTMLHMIRFVTNGMVNVNVVGAYIGAQTNGWPDGAAMFVRATLAEPIGSTSDNIRLVGRDSWPTNDFQSVWWRSGTNVFVNVLVEE